MFIHTTHQKGFSMLEVLIALLVLAVGMLGIAALQSQGQIFNNKALTRTQATMMAYDIMERMRINRDQSTLTEGVASPYAPATLPAPGDETDCDLNACDNPADLVTYDLVRWQQQIWAAMPGATASITVPADGQPNANRYVITITWIQRDTEMDDPNDDTQRNKSMTWVMTP